MNFKQIDKWSIRYAVTKFYVRFIHNFIFYRNICVTGTENLPKDVPLFFAPNHQNALMDALIVLCSIKAQPVFIARADIFKNPLLARILVSMKILPAYRIRDGKDNLKKNEEIFDVSVRILENKKILALFPEATHTDQRHLRVLKKGVQRIVFQAEEKNNFNLGVKVVPIGIYYSNYWNFKSDIQINFGKPIDIHEYLEIYKENPQKAMLALRDKISDELKPLIIHIKNMEYYDLYEFMREFYNKKMRKILGLKKSQADKFSADQKIIDLLDSAHDENPELIEKLKQRAEPYQKTLKKLNIRNWVVEKDEALTGLIIKSIGLGLSIPLFLYGLINNFIPYYLPKPLTSKLEDRQFTSSINFVFALIFYPIFYIIQFSIVGIFTEIWWIKFVYLISLPFSGVAAFYIHRWFVKLKAQWKYYFKQSDEIKELFFKTKKVMKSISNKYVH